MAMQPQITIIKPWVKQPDDLKRFLFIGPTGAGKKTIYIKAVRQINF
jgi:superfamily II DNA or RNA helicase